MKRTPLYQKHLQHGGKIIDFGGWELPVQYTSIIEEHRQVRSAAGLFDVSHMGEIAIKGSGALDFVQRLVTNDVSTAVPGQAVYSPMCYPGGGVVDDLLVYKKSDEEMLLVVNAANTDKDFDWIQQNIGSDAEAENISDSIAQLAVQGPLAQEILQNVCDHDLDIIKFYHFAEDVTVGGAKALVSRTGYTGEDGFEIYTSAKDAQTVWDVLIEAGSGKLKPAGLGARDTLRFEAALPLYGNELSSDITPVEAGLGMFVKPDKGEFVGRDVLAAQKQQGAERKLVGFEMTERGVPRSHFDVEKGGLKIGFVTSGSFSPTLNKTLGMALIEKQFADIGTNIDVIIRNKAVKAMIVKKPFYSKKYAK